MSDAGAPTRSRRFARSGRKRVVPIRRTTMAEQELISGLIETYRTLNTSVRGLDEQRLRTAQGDGSIHTAMKQMRDNELLFSQALKERVSGVPIATAVSSDERPTIGTETDQDTTAMMIAQFGTARESTLAMLRGLPSAEWDAVVNGESIRGRVTNLLENDRKQLAQINGLLAAA
jgi:hypothetical protein